MTSVPFVVRELRPKLVVTAEITEVTEVEGLARGEVIHVDAP